MARASVSNRAIRRAVRLALREARKIDKEEAKKKKAERRKKSKKDFTFSDADVIRFYNRNLTSDESFHVETFFKEKISPLLDPVRLDAQERLLNDGIIIVKETVEILAIIAIPDPIDSVVILEKAVFLFDKIEKFGVSYEAYLKSFKK